MGLIDTAEQTALAAAVRQLVAAHSPLSRVREVVDSAPGFDRSLWHRLAQQGLTGITIPESYGGAGGSFADLAPALRELGRGLVPSPLVASSVLAAQALLALDDEPVKKELLPQIAAGELVATVALSEPGSAGWGAPATTASETADGFVIEGTKRAVPHGAGADVLLVLAVAGDEAGLFLVRSEAAGLDITPELTESTVDGTPATATVTFTGTPAVRLAGDVGLVLSRVADAANLATACMQSAAIKEALDRTVEFAKARYSFGQPIGSYQGVKHKLADSYTAWCLVEAATRRAVEARDKGEPDASACAAAARLLASPAYVDTARKMMTLHGGIGFTWEHDAHLFFKNAVSSSVLLGTASDQRARLAELLQV